MSSARNLATLPEYEIRTWRRQRPGVLPLWTGLKPPPEVGERVRISVNNIGMGEVTGYGVEGGYLGVMVRLEDPPYWHLEQWPAGTPCLTFGAELAPYNPDAEDAR